MFSLLFTVMISKAAEPFHCERNGVWILVSDSAVECFTASGPWLRLAIVGALIFALAAFVAPVLFFLQVRSGLFLQFCKAHPAPPNLPDLSHLEGEPCLPAVLWCWAEADADLRRSIVIGGEGGVSNDIH